MKRSVFLVSAMSAAAIILLAACTSRSQKSEADDAVPPVAAQPSETAENPVPSGSGTVPVVSYPKGIAGTWYIEDADGWNPPTDGLNDPSIVFEDDGAVVYTGLNSLLAGYTVNGDDQTLHLDTSGPMTLVAGSDHQMHFESALLKVLPRVAAFILDEADGQLELYDADESLLIVLVRQKTDN